MPEKIRPALAREYSEQCVASTQAGSQCRLRVLPGSGYCSVHEKIYSPDKATPKCSAVTTSNKPCSIDADPGSSFCHLHDPAGKYQKNLLARRTRSEVPPSSRSKDLPGMSYQEARRLARMLVCPLCGVAVGRHCVNPKNRVYRNTHDQRIAGAGIVRENGRYVFVKPGSEASLLQIAESSDVNYSKQ